MSANLLPTSVTDTPAAKPDTRTGSGLPRWMREPLLHFLLLGGILFGIDHAIASREDDPRLIVIDSTVDAQAIAIFKEARDREPNAEELFALRRVWLDNEVLYREGLSLGLDRGDSAIRERVIFKALSVVDAGVKMPPYDETTIRQWFEKNRAKYDEPARYDFDEAVLAQDRSDAAARTLAQALNAGAPGDIEAGLRVFTGRPHENIVQSYGEEFATALESATAGEWLAIPSREGTRVVRMKSVNPGKPAVFEEVAGVVLQDWKDAVMSEQRSEAVRMLAKKYTVRTGPP